MTGRVRRAVLAWLLLALVLVPTVGQLHKVLHFAPHAGLAPAVVARYAHEPDARGAASGTPVGEGGAAPIGTAAPDGALFRALRRLLPQHTTADCELLDQLALGQALHAAALALPAALPPVAPALPRLLGRLARHTVAFHARGPPVR